MRTIGGILLGIFLFFPGIVLLKWLTVNVLGVYATLTLTDGCLVMIIILLCVHLVRSARPAHAPAAARARRTARNYDHLGEPQPDLLPSQEAVDRRRTRPRGRPSPRRRRQ